MAYGFRDDQYFFLKIRAAFPGIWLRTKHGGPATLAAPLSAELSASDVIFASCSEFL